LDSTPDTADTAVWPSFLYHFLPPVALSIYLSIYYSFLRESEIDIDIDIDRASSKACL